MLTRDLIQEAEERAIASCLDVFFMSVSSESIADARERFDAGLARVAQARKALPDAPPKPVAVTRYNPDPFP